MRRRATSFACPPLRRDKAEAIVAARLLCSHSHLETFPKLPLEGHRLNELSEEFVQQYGNKTRTNQAHQGCAREACGASAASPTRRRDAEAGFFYAGGMISAVIRVDRGVDALVVTLSALVPAVADGLVGDAVVLSRTPDPAIAAVADALGASLVAAPDASFAEGVKAARRDWILCLADGDVPTEGWVRALDRFIALSPPHHRLGRLSRRPAGLAETISFWVERLTGRRQVRAGDLVHRSVLMDGAAARPVRIAAVIERDPVFG